MSRSTASTTNEMIWGTANGKRELRVAAPATEIRLKGTWEVVQASGSAELTTLEGSAVARIFAEVRLDGCGSCVEQDDSPYGHGSRVVNASDSVGRDPQSVTAPPGIVTHDIVVRGPGGGKVPAGRYSVVGSTRAVAYIGCAQDSQSAFHLGGGNCVYPTTSGFAGSAETNAVLRLVNIEPTVVP